MRPQFVMFIAFLLIVGNLMCNIMDGDWVETDDTAQMNAMVGHQSQTGGGIPIITPVINWASGFWRTISWDFSFFNGAWEIVRWILFAISAGAVFAIAQEFRSTITSIFGRR